METTNLVLPLLVGCSIGGFIQGLAGFGFAVVAMSCWVWFLDPKLAASLTLLGGLLGQTISAVKIKKVFNIKKTFWYISGGLLGIPLGTLLLPTINIALFKQLLGLFLLIWCPLMLFSNLIPRLNIHHKAAHVIIGLCGGIMSGLGGFAGVLPTLWCTLNGENKNTQRAIIQSFSLCILWVTFATYIGQNLINTDHIKLFSMMVPVIIISSLIGSSLFKRISPDFFDV